MALFDEEPRQPYSDGRFLSVSLQRMNLPLDQELNLRIMVDSDCQPVIPPCDQPPYAGNDLYEAVDSLTLVTRELEATRPSRPKKNEEVIVHD